MTRNYLDILADTIRQNWDAPALTDFYLTADGTAQDTSRGNHYTYGEMYREICRVAEMLENYGLQKGDHIAICGSNSANWVIAYLAIAKMQGVSVTIMHTLMPDEIARQVEFADCKALFVDRNLWQQLVVKDSRPSPTLAHVIALDDFAPLGTHSSSSAADGTLNSATDALPLRYSHYRDTEGIAKGYDKDKICFPHTEPDEMVQICFTSGTTGRPKGAMYSIKNISSTTRCVANGYPMHQNKNTLSYFPLSHAFGLGLEIVVPLTYGAHIFMYRHEFAFDKMLAALTIVKPYQMVVVPTIAGMLQNERYLPYLPKIAGSIEYIINGGAGLPATIGGVLKKMGIPIAPGYGMTETVALIALSIPKTYKVGSSGQVCDALTARISPEGEILVKGENVMLGYYKDPESTAQKIDADGWLHTGDRGHLDEDGYLYVEGRMEQDIIVLPNGENIRPDDIEQKINYLAEVTESVVIARDGKLIALVVPRCVETHVNASPENEHGETQTQHDETHLHASLRNDLRLSILRQINPQLPLYSQLYDIEFLTCPLARTSKQTIKRYLYK